jgi:leucyl aminopeptidase
MNEGFTLGRESGSRPVWLLTAGQVEHWRDTLEPATANWARVSGFGGEKHRLLLLPGADGSVRGAAFGLGDVDFPQGIAPLSVAPLADKLPQGHWHVEASLEPEVATRVLLGWMLGRYRFDRYRTRAGNSLRSVSLAAPPGADVDFVRRAAAADALARDLINTPAADMGPAELGSAAAQLATRHGAEFSQLVGDALLEQRLVAIHTVGRAGPQEPRLLDLRWGDPDRPRLALVGKGVCFDTGGLDIKPSQSMALMKKDMGGAACTLGLAHMIMDAGLPVNLRVLVPAVENSVDRRAFRPGDVIHTRKGLTVEVGNTDAEGRLILADALALADEEGPDLVLDMATLTGAARTALGPEVPAMYSNDEELAVALAAASRRECDPLWRMPLWQPYDEDINGKVADLNNISGHGFAGSVIAALFLQRFLSAGRSWAHIDLYAWNGRDRPGRPVGAEAQCIRACYRAIEQRLETSPRI